MGLILTSLVVGVALQFSGSAVLSFDSEGGTLPTWVRFGFHWSAFVLFCTVLLGLLCIVLPSRQPD
jgi:hypothetical protein